MTDGLEQYEEELEQELPPSLRAIRDQEIRLREYEHRLFEKNRDAPDDGSFFVPHHSR